MFITHFIMDISCNCGEGLRRNLLIPMQLEDPKPKRKVSIIGGAGTVATAIAYTMSRQLICDEIHLIDVKDRKDKLCGEAFDIIHGRGLFSAPKLKVGCNLKVSDNSDVIIIACGHSRKANESRRKVAQENIDLMKSIIPPLAKHSPEAVFVVVTNPVDIISYAVWQYSCFPKNRIIGTGTTIDSLRFRHHLSKRLGAVHPKNIDAHILLEHGDLAVPIWSLIHVAGNRLADIDYTFGTTEDKNNWNSLFKETMKAGSDLLSHKGGSFFTIAYIVCRIVDDILKDSKAIHNVSLQANGLYGLCENVYLSLPAVLGNRGIFQVVQQNFDDDEIKKFNTNARVMIQECKCLKF